MVGTSSSFSWMPEETELQKESSQYNLITKLKELFFHHIDQLKNLTGDTAWSKNAIYAFSKITKQANER